MRNWIKLLEQESTAFQKLEQAMRALGLKVEMWEDEERVDLHWIERLPGTPAGAGAEAVEMLCNYADENHKPILLQVENEALAVYYEQFGFVEADEDEWEDHWPDWDIDDSMIRYPERGQ